MRKFIIVFLLLCVICLCSCQNEEVPEQNTPAEQEVIEKEYGISDLLNTSLKVKTEITDRESIPEEKVSLEFFVDANGNGEGLLGTKDIVVKAIISDYKLYLVASETSIVSISDINGIGVFSALDLTSAANLEELGFEAVDNFPVSYSGAYDGLLLYTRYASSDKQFNPVRVSGDTEMNLRDAIDYVIECNNLTPTTEEEQVEATPVTSFYRNDPYGVEIEGVVYSLGDTCAPSTYFGERVPEGFLESYEYKEDSKVVFTHISYNSDSGRTVFTTTENYVQTITTNADFNFAGISKGIDNKTLEKKLGWKLSKKEAETYIPYDENIVIESVKSNIYYAVVGEYNVEFRFTKGILTEISISQPMNFVKE